MPLTSSFMLSTNDSGSEEFSGIYNLIHKTDLSDNPQVKTLWLMSLLDTKRLRASSDPGVDPITITVVDSLPIWEDTVAYTVGQAVQPTISNGFRYRCTTAGTSSGTEPTWPTSGIGSTVIDGTAVWELQGPKHDPDQITLALNEDDLDTNTPGDPLTLPNTILGGVDEAVEIWIKIENALTLTTNTGTIPDVKLRIPNEIFEDDIP